MHSTNPERAHENHTCLTHMYSSLPVLAATASPRVATIAPRASWSVFFQVIGSVLLPTFWDVLFQMIGSVRLSSSLRNVLDQSFTLRLAFFEDTVRLATPLVAVATSTRIVRVVVVRVVVSSVRPSVAILVVPLMASVAVLELASTAVCIFAGLLDEDSMRGRSCCGPCARAAREVASSVSLFQSIGSGRGRGGTVSAPVHFSFHPHLPISFHSHLSLVITSFHRTPSRRSSWRKGIWWTIVGVSKGFLRSKRAGTKRRRPGSRRRVRLGL